MLTVDLVGRTETMAIIRARGSRIIQAIIRKMNSSMIALQAYIVTSKLSGQVLKHRSGKLANSIRVNQAEAEGATITASVQGAGGPAWYGKLHEYGTDSPFTIRAINKKALHFVLGGKDVFVKSVLHPPIKERSFMRTSFAERQTNIVESVREGFTEALNG